MSSLSSILSLEHGNWNIIIAIISLISITTPIFCGFSFNGYQNSPAIDAIISHEAQIGYGMLAVSTWPLFLDTLSDYGNFYNIAKWRQYLFGRVPIAIAGFLISLQFFLIIRIPSIFGLTNDIPTSYFYCVTCFRIVLTSCLMFMLTNVKPSIFGGRLTTFVTLTACFISSVRMYTPGSSPTYASFSITITYIGLAVLLVILLHWASKLIKTRHNMTVADYTCILYMGTFFLTLFISYVILFQIRSENDTQNNFSSYGARGVAFVNYTYIAIFILLTIAPGRIARFEAVIHLVS